MRCWYIMLLKWIGSAFCVCFLLCYRVVVAAEVLPKPPWKVPCHRHDWQSAHHTWRLEWHSFINMPPMDQAIRCAMKHDNSWDCIHSQLTENMRSIFASALWRFSRLCLRNLLVSTPCINNQLAFWTLLMLLRYSEMSVSTLGPLCEKHAYARAISVHTHDVSWFHVARRGHRLKNLHLFLGRHV